MNDLPELPERELPTGRHRVLKEHLMREIRTEDSVPARRRWLRPSIAVPAVAVLAAAAVVAGLAVTGPDGGGVKTASPEAVRLLNDIALAAEKSEVPGEIRDDQFVYIESKGGYIRVGEGMKTKLTPVHRREVWHSVDGTKWGLLKEIGPGSDTTKLDPDTPGLDSNTNYRNLQTLPTDPAKMLDWLHRTSGGGKSEDQNTFVLVGDLVGESLMPPKVSAALYRAAAKISGVTVVDDVVDAAGRHGIAIAREDDGILEQLIFDKNTKTYLGEREVAVRDLPNGLKKGDLAGTSAIMNRTVVDRPGQQP
ncbi:CU044_5270 family protein [Streptomyces beijiangensis]|uniref:CU044_5270 family protein n=1 Tax=Streptomyces beijiangensis TaxID=163361 RepID=A0A939F1R9_9ACTN|nr:CU044_5270 family protein [Streptomyces beijiangensis]MBO0510906.1 CU044_5270 family protein [Streptomyces beijiangensis]